MKKMWLSFMVTLFWLLSVLFFNVQATPGGDGGPVGTGGATGLTAILKDDDLMWVYGFFGVLGLLILIMLILLINKDKKEKLQNASNPQSPPPTPFKPPVPTAPFYGPQNSQISGNTEPSTWNGKPWGFPEGETPLEGTKNTIIASRTPGQSCITVTDSTTYINGKLVPPGTYYLVKGNTVNSGGHSITF